MVVPGSFLLLGFELGPPLNAEQDCKRDAKSKKQFILQLSLFPHLYFCAIMFS